MIITNRINNLIDNIFTTAKFADLLEISVIILEVLYVILAFIAVRQVSLMNRSFHTKLAFFLSLVAYIHFFASIGLLIFSLILF